MEKARASFLDRLKAEWAAPIGAQSEADNLGPESDKRGEEIYKPGAEPTKAELLDTKGPNGKPIFEPLRLKWGSWEYEKRVWLLAKALILCMNRLLVRDLLNACKLRQF